MSIKFSAHRLALAGLLFVFCATSQADESADAFIEKIKTVTYDCPNPDDFTTLNEFLLSDSLTTQQRFNLSVLKSHFLICQGQSDEAESLLFELVSQKDIGC